MGSVEKSLNIILLGRKYWSAKALMHLLDKGHNVLAVVGKPAIEELDSKKGSLIDLAKKHNILTPTIDELYSWFRNPLNSPIPVKKIDLVISYLFWQKVKQPLLSAPKLGAINFHPAPLPDYKGLGGYNIAIMDGCSTYGVSAHLMNEEIDEGEIIRIRRFKINKENETAFSLENKSQIEMFELFKETLTLVEENKLKDCLTKNQKSEGIYINREKFEEMKFINEDDPEEIVKRKIRAFWYPPYEGAKIKVGEQFFTLTDSKILSSISKVLHS